MVELGDDENTGVGGVRRSYNDLKREIAGA